jgi:hypothetical protein
VNCSNCNAVMTEVDQKESVARGDPPDEPICQSCYVDSIDDEEIVTDVDEDDEEED